MSSIKRATKPFFYSDIRGTYFLSLFMKNYDTAINDASNPEIIKNMDAWDYMIVENYVDSVISDTMENNEIHNAFADFFVLLGLMHKYIHKTTEIVDAYDNWSTTSERSRQFYNHFITVQKNTNGGVWIDCEDSDLHEIHTDKQNYRMIFKLVDYTLYGKQVQVPSFINVIPYVPKNVNVWLTIINNDEKTMEKFPSFLSRIYNKNINLLKDLYAEAFLGKPVLQNYPITDDKYYKMTDDNAFLNVDKIIRKLLLRNKNQKPAINTESIK